MADYIGAVHVSRSDGEQNLGSKGVLRMIEVSLAENGSTAILDGGVLVAESAVSGYYAAEPGQLVLANRLQGSCHSRCAPVLDQVTVAIDAHLSPFTRGR